MLSPKTTLFAAAASFALSAMLHAHPVTFNATITYSSSQPSGGAVSTANWTGATFDAANIGGSGVNADGGSNNGAANNASTYVANNQPIQGQTFTTGTNANGYDVSSITVRMAGYTNSIATGTNGTSWNLNFTNGPILLQIGKLSGTTASTLVVQGFTAGGTGNPGSGQTANGPGTYLTFNLAYPVHLAANTTYGFDLSIGNGNSNYFEWLGISGTTAYTGGTAYTRSGSTITPLSGQRVFMVNMTASASAYAPFTHPGTLHAQADIDRMKTKIAASASPWINDYNILLSSPYAGNWGGNAVTTIYRGNISSLNNYTHTQNDAQALYEHALLWQLTGNQSYATQAVNIANNWAQVCTGVSGDSNYALASGICGYEFAIAGELLSTYSGWAAADKQAYKDWMMRVFYPLNYDFLWRHNGTAVNFGGNTHYRLNWDLDNMASMAAIGILCDNKAVYQQAVDYFKYGCGNGRVERAAWYIHPDGIAQTEESGRDQGHDLGGWYSMGLLCQMAWNQGDDLFGYDNNRVLRAYEYVAKYNVGYDVPWVYHRNTDLSYTETLSSSGRGLGGYYQNELVYNHYANVVGIAAPYSKLAMQATRPEPRPNTSIHPSQVDWFGLGSLTFARDDTTTSAAPSGLAGRWSKNQVKLTWWGSATATSYQVKRATSLNGTYSTIGTVTGLDLNYTDNSVVNGTSYYYKVTAVTPGGNLDSSPLLVNQALVTRYTFEGNANDVVGTGNATAMGGTSAPGYASGFGGGQAISLNGADQYVQLPAGSGNYRDITIAAWVYWNGGGTWQRVFDFGTEIEKYMMLTVNAGSNLVRFQMTTSRTTDGTLTLTGTTMPTATWMHIAVTFNGDTATLYMNGVPVATGVAPMVAPIFGQPFCYLGRSMWDSDPYFSGKIDDFRIYNYPLSGAAVYSLWGQSANHAPAFSSNPLNYAAATQDVNYSTLNKTLASSASDADGGTLTYTKITGPSWLTVASNGALSGTPTNSDVGVSSFVVRVTDSSGATDDANLYITVNNVNDAPTWLTSPLTKPSVTRDQPYITYTLAADATDLDIPYGDSFTFSKVSGPAWLSVAASGALSGTPGVSDVGTDTFTVRVTDQSGAYSDTTLTITVLPFQQRAYLQFENNLNDTLGNFPGSGNGTIIYGAGRLGNGLLFDSTSTYATLPAGVADSQDITVAAWVFWNGGNAWQRIFDFGNSTTQYLALTPNNGSSNMRFEIANGGTYQQVYAPSLATGQWIHIALTLTGSTAKLYTNAVLSGSNTAITIHPGDFKSIYNYIGKSQYPADPLFNGTIDDLRVYNYALNASDIAALIDIVPAVPLNVIATAKMNSVSLSWSASQGAQSYTVKRSFSSSGPYTVIASGLTGASYSDTALTNGTSYYYIVTASNARGESAGSTQVSAVPSDLLAYLKFDETSGTTATDSSGNGWNGTLGNGPIWAPGVFNGGITIPAVNNESVMLPTGVVSGLSDFTVSGWVKVNSFNTWARVFDFGTGTTNYMFLTTQYTSTAPNNAKPRFAIRTPSIGEQQLNSSIALSGSTWTHFAVTLSGSMAKLYISGSLAATNTSMALNPLNLGNTNLNFLGDSQTSSDPTLNGQLDDFRIYSRALSAIEIAAMAAPMPATPANFTATGGDHHVVLNWSASNYATTYTLKRATTSGGPYTNLAVGLTGTTYVDSGMVNDVTYYYVVSGTNWLGESANSNEVSATTSYLHTYLKLDEASGTTAADSSGNGWSATTANSPAWEPGEINNALHFTSTSSQYAALPSGVVSGLADYTIICWVKLSTVAANARIFDFGTSTTPGATTGTYMFLSPSSGGLRFAVTTAGYNNEQTIQAGAPLVSGTWAHVAVTLSGTIGKLYLNGALAATNSAMTLNPSSLGTLTQNYLGKSQFSVDPYLNGWIDDFRIYSRAMSASEVALFASPLAVPQNVLAAANGPNINLSWSNVVNADTYTVSYATNSGGPYSAAASGLTSPSYTHAGLSPSTTYYYVVTASNIAGTSPGSTEASATVSPLITNAEARNVRTTYGYNAQGGSIVTFTVPASVVGHSYQLQYTNDLAGTWTNIGDAQPGTGSDLGIIYPIDPAATRSFFRIIVQR